MESKLEEAQTKFSRGTKLVADISKPGIFNSIRKLFIDKETIIREGMELISESAELFKIARKYDDAILAYMEAAKLKIQQEDSDAPTSYLSAALMAKLAGRDNTAYIESAVDMYIRSGRTLQAGRQMMNIATDYDNAESIDSAIIYYTKAIDLFQLADSASDVRKATIKLAHLVEPDKAMVLFEKVADDMINGISKYSAKEYYFKACLCRLLVDQHDTTICLNRYQQSFSGFYDSREARFVGELCKAIENSSIDDFISAVTEFDKVSPLDKWYTSILCKIKKLVNVEESLL